MTLIPAHAALTRTLATILLISQSLVASATGRLREPVGSGSQAPSNGKWVKAPIVPIVHAISAEEKKLLSGQLELAPDVSIKIDSHADSATLRAPISISGAKVRAVKRGAGNATQSAAADSQASSPNSAANDYAMRATVVLHNYGGRRIRAFGLQFANVEAGTLFFVYRAFPINPGPSMDFEIPLILVTGNPAGMEVELVAAESEDGAVWGSFSSSPTIEVPPLPSTPPLASRSSEPAATPQAATAPKVQGDNSPIKFDKMPQPLNRPRPIYTEEARTNGISARTWVRALVNAEGVVQRVVAIHSLPDGLTEQAIAAVNEMRFSPAMKDGAPAACWVALEVEFHIR
jgi:TonB family protein